MTEKKQSINFMKSWLKDMYHEDKTIFNVGMTFHASQDTPSAKGAAVEKFLKYELNSYGLITSKPSDTAAADYSVNGYDYQFKGYTVKNGKEPIDTWTQASTMVKKHKRSEPAVDFANVLNYEFFRDPYGSVVGEDIGKFLEEEYKRPADVLQMIDENTKKGSIYVFEFEPLFNKVVGYERDKTDKRIYHLYDTDHNEIIHTGPNTTNANCWYRGVWLNYQFIIDNVKPTINNVKYGVYDVYEIFKKGLGQVNA